MAHSWFVYKDQVKQGPYSWEQLKGKAFSGELVKEDYIWTEGMEDWTEAKNVADLFSEAPLPEEPGAAAPPPVPGQIAQSNMAPPKPDQAPVKKRSGKKLALIIGGSVIALFVVIIIVAVFAARTTLVNSIIYEKAVNELNGSSEAAELLGKPIEVGSNVFGTINASNGRGDAELEIPVSGPLNSGDLLAEGVLAGGQWQLTYLELVLEDGRRLDLLAEKEIDEEAVETVTGDDGESDNGLSESDSPVEVLESWFSAYSNLEFEKSKQYIASNLYDWYSEEYVADYIMIMQEGGLEAKIATAIVEIVLDYTEFEIISYEIDGDQAMVYTVESAPDVDQLNEMAMNKASEMLEAGEIDIDAMTDAEFLDFIIEINQALILEVDIITEELSYEFVKEEGVWKISDII